MKPANSNRIARAIAASLPALHEKGRLLAVTPRGRILRGIYLEDSSDPTRVYVWAFVQPLYAPASTVSFDLGKRLGGSSKTWSMSDVDDVVATARDEGMPFIGPISSPEALASWAFLEGRFDPYAREAKAYSLVASGRFGEGAHVLRDLARSLSGGMPWMIEMRRRAERLADLAETDPDGARDLLARWEMETTAALRVQDLP